MKAERDSIGERLASNPGTPIAVAAALVAGFSPFSPIRHAVSWIQDGVRRRPAGGTVDAAPAAPTPPADAGTQPPSAPSPVADPVATPTPVPAMFAGMTLGEALRAGQGQGIAEWTAEQERRMARGERALPWIQTASPASSFSAEWLTANENRPFSDIDPALRQQLGFNADGYVARTHLSAADVAASVYAPTPPRTDTPTFTPLQPEPTSPGPSPSPQTGSGNDGGWLDRAKDLLPDKPETIPGGEQIGALRAKSLRRAVLEGPKAAFNVAAEAAGFGAGETLGFFSELFRRPKDQRIAHERELERIEESSKRGFGYVWDALTGKNDHVDRMWGNAPRR